MQRRTLSNLATDGTRHSQAGVDVGEEAGWVGLDLGNVEVGAEVDAVVTLDTGDEGPGQAANADALVVADGDRVREGNARRSGVASGSLVDVGGGGGGLEELC